MNFDTVSYLLGRKSAGGGGSVTVEPLTVAQNGTYTAPSGKAYSPVEVNVKAQPTNELADITLIDYEGTVLHTYTAEEFLALDALPANPDRTAEGLTAQGWNWTLAEAKTYVADHGLLVIGQMYRPTDGKTHLFVKVFDHTKPVVFRWSQRTDSTIDFGDGSDPVTVGGTGLVQYAKTFQADGDYEVTLSGTSLEIGWGNSGPVIERPGLSAMLTKAYLVSHNSNAAILANALRGMSSMSGAVIDPAFKKINAAAFETTGITGLVLPNGMTDITTGSISNCPFARYISLPPTMTGVSGNGAMSNNGTMQVITVPDSVTIFGNPCGNCVGMKAFSLSRSVAAVTGFGVCSSLWHIKIPEGATSIGNYVFTEANSALDVDIPSTMTSIGTGAFTGLLNCMTVTVRATTPPTLVNSSGISGFPSDTRIIVPRGTLEAYQTATNWSTYASRMEEGDV